MDNNEYMEYETFEMEIKGEKMELAIMEEFEYEENKYVLAAKVEGDTIKDEEGCYIFKSTDAEDGTSIEIITDKQEYAEVTDYYANL